MGLDNFLENKDQWPKSSPNYDPKDKGFTARSTGCSCCSMTYDSKDEEAKIEEEAIDSIGKVLRARRYFKWDFEKMVKIAKTRITRK